MDKGRVRRDDGKANHGRSIVNGGWALFLDIGSGAAGSVALNDGAYDVCLTRTF